MKMERREIWGEMWACALGTISVNVIVVACPNHEMGKKCTCPSKIGRVTLRGKIGGLRGWREVFDVTCEKSRLASK